MSDFSVNVFEALRRIGSKAPFRFPLLDTYLPVVKMFDLSDLVSAPLPPRGLAGFDLPGVGLLQGTYQIASRGPGGIVIETMALDLNVDTTWEVGINPVGLGLTDRTILNVGEPPVQSTFSADNGVAGIGPNQVLFPGGPEQPIYTSQSWRIPPGQFFQVRSRAQGFLSRCLIIFREIPASFEEA